jgi:2-dehydro-3-deoxyphosphogluconate aldolase/(4S)-4-hydroxy-2-oxoglutarate aldolase
MSKDQILNLIYTNKIIAVVRLKGEDNAIKVAEALVEGGIKIIELTLTTPNAFEIIKELSNLMDQDVLIGAGSVLNVEMAEKAIKSGAKFIVSPISNFDLIEVAHSNNLPVMLGAYTPTEIFSATKNGADIVKVFPADGLGMNYFKSIKAPMPNLNIMPTGGVTLSNVNEWIKAGASAVGIGSALVTSDQLKNEDYLSIKNNARMVVNNLNEDCF